MSHEAVAFAGRPLVAESQRQVVVDLFENHLVSVGILVEVALDGIGTLVLFGERLPQHATFLGINQNDGFASRGFC